VDTTDGTMVGKYVFSKPVGGTIVQLTIKLQKSERFMI
jgi:hypothetical protein